MVEQSSTVPQSIYKEDLNHTLGLTLSTPGLVNFLFPELQYVKKNLIWTIVEFQPLMK